MILFGTGFRPFFLGAAGLAAISMGTWGMVLSGLLSSPGPLPSVQWHAHEMLFGFAVAVLAGFFLTAVQNWTKQVTARGGALAAVFALWLGGRVAAWVDLGVAGLVVDVAFLFVLAGVIARPLWIAGSKRNYAFVPMLVAMGCLDLAAHLGTIGPALAHLLTLDLIVLILTIVGGRIIPLFTKNAAPASKAYKVPRIDNLALGLTWAVLGADCVLPSLAPAVAFLAGAVHLLRMRTWGSIHTLRTPILWVLHLGYLWVAIGLLARAASGLHLIPSTAALHILTAGGIGTLTLGMMTRVGLGHTGRKIVAPPLIVVAYGLIFVAAIVRVLAALGMNTLVLAAGVFSLCFILYFLVYLSILTAPRPDGRPG